ncbi:hypothetical protein Poly59_17150 [Rubripirellula reticaptiva]|uniref:Uncharacterized protein n=1 Tax=Rubripirellula reticaptiva TaxID=2528013 RepID=A0A5C6F4P1_9BACT|nr:hypothetical protein Poly59_17150 [Rubripirellula reticaptiva]
MHDAMRQANEGGPECWLDATHRNQSWRLIRTSCSDERTAKQGRQGNGYRRTIVRGNIKRGVMEYLV